MRLSQLENYINEFKTGHDNAMLATNVDRKMLPLLLEFLALKKEFYQTTDPDIKLADFERFCFKVKNLYQEALKTPRSRSYILLVTLWPEKKLSAYRDKFFADEEAKVDPQLSAKTAPPSPGRGLMK